MIFHVLSKDGWIDFYEDHFLRMASLSRAVTPPNTNLVGADAEWIYQGTDSYPPRINGSLVIGGNGSGDNVVETIVEKSAGYPERIDNARFRFTVYQLDSRDVKQDFFGMVFYKRRAKEEGVLFQVDDNGAMYLCDYSQRYTANPVVPGSNLLQAGKEWNVEIVITGGDSLSAYIWEALAERPLVPQLKAGPAEINGKQRGVYIGFYGRSVFKATDPQRTSEFYIDDFIWQVKPSIPHKNAGATP